MTCNIQKHIVRVGARAVLHGKANKLQNDAQWSDLLSQPRPGTAADEVIQTWPAFDAMPDQHTMGATAKVVYDWISNMRSDPSATPLWLTNIHLLVHFQTTTACPGVQFNQATNKWQFLTYSEEDFEFPKAANWLGAAFRCLGRYLGLDIKGQSRVPSGSIYRCWTPCMLLRMSPTAFQDIENKLRACGATGVQSVRKSFGSLPSFHQEA